ncbi:hypothetical protein PMAYCL1PPCAC_30986, partial [Pristionchus mayeri]
LQMARVQPKRRSSAAATSSVDNITPKKRKLEKKAKRDSILDQNIPRTPKYTLPEDDDDEIDNPTSEDGQDSDFFMNEPRKRNTEKKTPKKSVSTPKKVKKEKKSARDTTRDQWIASRGGFDPVVRWGAREGSSMRPGKRRVSLLDAFQANAVLIELGEDPTHLSGWQPKCEAIHDILLANREHSSIVKPKNNENSDEESDEDKKISPIRKSTRDPKASKLAKIEKSKKKSDDDDEEETEVTPSRRAKRAAAKSTPSKRGPKKVTPKKSDNDIARAKWIASRGGYDPIVRWDTKPGSRIKPGQKRLSLLDAFQANNVLIEMGVDPSGLKGWEAKFAAIQDRLQADRSHYDVVVHPDLSDESDDEKDAEDEYNAFINGGDDDEEEEEEDEEDREAEEEYNAFLNNSNDDDDNDEKDEDDDDFDDAPSEDEEDSDYIYQPGKANKKTVKKRSDMKEGAQILPRGRGRPPGSTDSMPRSARGHKKPARDWLRDRWIASMGGYDPTLRWGSRDRSTMRPGKRRLSLLDAFQANAVLVELGEDPKQYSGWQPKCEAIHKILSANREHPIIVKPILDSDSDDESD